MTPLNLSDIYFPQYKIIRNRLGNQIQVKICPFCGGGERKDQWTFALSEETGVYNCKRGKCGAKGSFNELLKFFGEDVKKTSTSFIPMERKKMIKHKIIKNKIKTLKTNPLTDKAIKYIKSRKISIDTALKFKLFCNDRGNIVFPYYDANSELVLYKWHTPHKPKKKEQKAGSEPGGNPGLFGLQFVDTSKPLIITEGEFDTVAIEEAMAGSNAVSIPYGCSGNGWIEYNWEILDKFKKIIIWFDNDAPGIEAQEKVINRLGSWRCYTISSEYKDANECLLFQGYEFVQNLIKNAKEVQINGMIMVSEISDKEDENIERVTSGFDKLDRILGGFKMGELTVWTGVNSSGKSTFLGQVLLSSLNNSYKVSAYSGELPVKKFKKWIYKQASDFSELKERYDYFLKRNVTYVSDGEVKRLNGLFQNKLFMFDAKLGMVNGDIILDSFESMYRRHGCKIFLIDNLMMLDQGGASDSYVKQTEFVKKIKSLTIKFPIHIHLVAHPRKILGRIITKLDVSGSGNITNIADNVIGVHRIEEEAEKEKYNGADNLIIVFKNREVGMQNKIIPVYFSEEGKRFTDCGLRIFENYDWDNKKEKTTPF